MSFWLEDDNTHGAVANHNPWSLSGSSSSAAAAASHPQDPPQPAQEEPQQEGSQHALWSQPETQDSSTVYLSQQEQLQFVCDNCGGTECYLDDATGRDVCALCFTESQQSQSQQLLSQQGADTVADFEDVVALAARHAGGRIRQQKRSTKKKQQQQAASGETRRYKQPLEEVDRSVPLPDLSVCLRGMQRVLQTCVDRAVAQVEAMELVVERHPTRTAGANNDSDNDDDDDDWDGVEAQQEEPLFVESSASQSRQQEYRDAAREMIQSLWKSYLRAWADGAEHYGAMYPHVRFCFRDLFLVSMHASLVVRRQLVHQVATTIKQEEIDEPFGRLPRRDGDASDDSSSDHDGDDDNDEDEEDPKDKSENVKKEMGGIRLGAMRKIVAAHTSFRNPMGYKEAALYLRPSMHMAAALIWMALTKNKKAALAAAPVTSHDVCRWIATGKLPLMTAFHSLLSPKLQKRLQPVSTFFRIDKPLLPCELEAMAINLCVACRLRKTPKLVNEDGEDSGDEDDESSDASSTATGKASKQSAPQASSDNDGDNRSNELTAPAIVVKKRKRQRVRFWSVADLPRIMAQLVADAGMDQNVLDRSLVLAGYSLEGPSPRRHQKQLRPPPPDEPSSRRPSSGSEKTRNDTAAEKPLTNLSDHLSRLPTLVEPEALTCAEEVLALIAIACQLDPQWRTWKYSSSTLLQQPTQQQQQQQQQQSVPPPTAPWNEAQFRSLTNGASLDSYLRFVEQYAFPDGGADADNNNNSSSKGNQLTSLLPQEYFDAVGGSLESEVELYKKRQSDAAAAAAAGEDGGGNEIEFTSAGSVVRPCPVLAGAELQGEVDVSNMTHRLLNHDLSAACRASLAGKPKSSGDSTFNAKRLNKNLDPLILLPRHDFRKAEYAASNRVPNSSPDPDQARLVEFLAFTAGADPVALQRAMNSILQQKKKLP